MIYKFRFWDKAVKKYLYDSSFLTPPFNDDKYIVEQFSGCQDKNGNDIFDGDILLGYYTRGFSKRPKVPNLFVYTLCVDGYGLDNYMRHYHHHSYVSYRNTPFLKDTFVVGNSNENPEVAQEIRVVRNPNESIYWNFLNKACKELGI